MGWLDALGAPLAYPLATQAMEARRRCALLCATLLSIASAAAADRALLQRAAAAAAAKSPAPFPHASLEACLAAAPLAALLTPSSAGYAASPLRTVSSAASLSCQSKQKTDDDDDERIT